MKKSVGKVYLVGAGSGDPGLLTLRGKELLERAQVVVYDALVNATHLRHAPSAEHIFVGKQPGRHHLTQEDISRLLVEQAKLGACVVRLKGGDPFVFGRGGEEALALSEAGVLFEVVPGVTAGIGAAAYAGIPITQRGISDRVTFIMGHQSKSDRAKPRLDQLPHVGTLVIYMGVEEMEENMEVVHKSGRSLETPVAVVEWGTLPRQRTIVGTVGTIVRQCADAGIEAPSIIVVGEAVELCGKLSWFENRPLFGRRVAVTRTRERAAELVSLLQEQGADVLEFPTVEIETPQLCKVSLAPLSDYDWVILTSVNGVDALFDRMVASGQDARDLHGVKLCAISAKTAEALSDRLLRVDVIPERYETDFVLQRLDEHDRASKHQAGGSGSGGGIAGKRILMPRADIGRSSLPKALRERGAVVDELQAYRTVVPGDAGARADELVRYAPHYVTFGSAVSVRNFREILGADRIAQLSGHDRASSLDARSCLEAPSCHYQTGGSGTRYAAIGPIAELAAKESGISIDIVPEVHRVPDLVDAIVRFDASQQT